MATSIKQSSGSPTPLSSKSIAPARRQYTKRCGTTRERTGCLTCRQRRKKCDNTTYPICGHCRRLNLECVREDPRPLSKIAAPYSERRKSSTGTGIINFDSQKEPCLVPSSHFAIVKIPMIPQAMPMAISMEVDYTSDRRYLLKYYTQILSMHTSTNHENNSFLSVFIPMAMESPPLLTSIIAWSSAHLSCFQTVYHVPTLEKKSTAIRSVARSLSNPSSDVSIQETNIAACLVLCSMEVALGDSQWHQHLVGAKHLIAATKVSKNGQVIRGTRALMLTFDGEWLLRNFAYHDVLGTVVTGRKPLIRGPYWLRDNLEVVDSYVGVASRILFLISEISCLDIPASFNQDDSDNIFLVNSGDGEKQEDRIWSQCTDLESQLQSWICPSVDQKALDAMAEAWRSSALLYLYRKMRSLFAAKQESGQASFQTTEFGLICDKIEEQVETILAQLALIPLTSLPECGLLFPLFMAGGDTTNPEYVAVIRKRLRLLREHRGFQNLDRAMEVLEELWRLKSSGSKGGQGAVVDWMDITARTGVILSLA